jgi:hypothetical protein
MNPVLCSQVFVPVGANACMRAVVIRKLISQSVTCLWCNRSRGLCGLVQVHVCGHADVNTRVESVFKSVSTAVVHNGRHEPVAHPSHITCLSLCGRWVRHSVRAHFSMPAALSHVLGKMRAHHLCLTRHRVLHNFASAPHRAPSHSMHLTSHQAAVHRINMRVTLRTPWAC